MRPDQASIARRAVLAGGLALAVGPHALAAVSAPREHAAFAAIERRTGGRLGVCALETGPKRRIAWRADERFPMCSTFKWLAVSAVLAQVDRGVEKLDRRIAYGPADLLSYAPVARAHVGEGSLPLGVLCEAAITLSDNTAANLILSTLGGPAGLTRWLRAHGGGAIRLDRTEPTLNTAIPGDPRDTATPAAMASALDRIVLGQVLSGSSRTQLQTWMRATKTGDHLLRAGLPQGVRVGDKTGNGANGTQNDVGVVWPAAGSPVVIAAFLTGAKDEQQRAGAIAEVARIVASGWRLG